MIEALLIRKQQGFQGTFGFLKVPGFSCFTGELPWRDNRTNISCIPAGTYKCRWRRSPRFGWVFQVMAVPGRSHVLLHSGNLCGDRAKGQRTHTHGCILLGKFPGTLGKQKAVLCSRPTVRALAKNMNYKPFKLIIEEDF